MAPPKGPPLAAVDAAQALSRGLSALQRRLAPAPIPLLELITGHWRVRALGVVTRLGVAEQLAGGPRDVASLAAACGAHEESLYRLLRALASDGIVDWQPPRTFALNAVSAPLGRHHPRSIYHTVMQITSSWNWRTWGELEASVRDGEPAFPRLFGGELWSYLDTAPDEAEHFHASMRELTRLDMPALLPAYDFGQHRSLVDVGGGSGQMLAGILAAYPAVRGVLYDRADATRDAPRVLREAGVQDRAEVVVGSFLESVPAGHDAYLMRQIAHGCTDEQLRGVLGNVRQAMAPRARLLALEALVPDDRQGRYPAFIDLQMLVGSGGHERSRGQFARLFEANGLRLVEVVRTAALTAVFVAERA